MLLLYALKLPRTRQLFWGRIAGKIRWRRRRLSMTCPASAVAGMISGSGGSKAMLRRHELTYEQWNAIKSVLPGKEGERGGTGKANRLFVNAIFFVGKTGIPS